MNTMPNHSFLDYKFQDFIRQTMWRESGPQNSATIENKIRANKAEGRQCAFNFVGPECCAISEHIPGGKNEHKARVAEGSTLKEKPCCHMCQQQLPVSICIYNIPNPKRECVFCKTPFKIMHLIAPCILQPICKHTQTVSTPSPHILFSVPSTTAILKPVLIVLYCIQNIIIEP